MLKANPKQKIIILTAADDKDMAETMLKVGVACYFTKHVDLDSFIKSIEAVHAG